MVLRDWPAGLGFVFTLSVATAAQAAIPIETVPLSTPSLQAAQAATPANPASLSSGDGSAAVSTQPSMLWNLYQQVQRLEQEVRSLRGRVETHDEQLDNLQSDLKNRFTDLDQRLIQLASTAEAATPSPAALPAPAQPATPTAVPAPTHVANSAAASAPAPTVAATQPADPEADKRAYLAAYDAYKAGGAAQAIQPMSQFITQFPQSVYIANANYWLGEFYLANTPPDFAKARSQFERVMQDYAQSPKASSALYRLATLAEVEGKPAEAARHMNRLIRDYSDSKEAGFARTYFKTHPVAKPASKTPAAAPAKKPVPSATAAKKPAV